MAHVYIAHDIVLDPVLAVVAEKLQAAGHRLTRGPVPVPGAKSSVPTEKFAQTFADVDVLVSTTRFLTPPALLDEARQLRGVVFPSIGTETLDIADATRRGVLVANGSTPENVTSMAEATVMLILNLLYGLRRSEALLRQNLPRPTRPHARMLGSAAIGLLGFGRIGRAVAQRLVPFGCQLLVHSLNLGAHDMPPGIVPVSLDELLARSDVVSVHATPDPSGRALLGQEQLARMRPEAFLVNTARGACIDEQALFTALQKRQIAGAALDAFVTEPLPVDSRLRSIDGLLLTPHLVGHTREMLDSFGPVCLGNVQALLSGQAPSTLMNPDALPAWRLRFTPPASQR